MDTTRKTDVCLGFYFTEVGGDLCTLVMVTENFLGEVRAPAVEMKAGTDPKQAMMGGCPGKTGLHPHHEDGNPLVPLFGNTGNITEKGGLRFPFLVKKATGDFGKKSAGD